MTQNSGGGGGQVSWIYLGGEHFKVERRANRMLVEGRGKQVVSRGGGVKQAVSRGGGANRLLVEREGSTGC